MPCPHNQNPRACLSCYHAAQSKAPTQMPAQKAAAPINNVIASVKTAHVEAQRAEGHVNGKLRAAGLPKMGVEVLEPTVHPGPVRMGYEQDGSPIKQPEPTEELGRPKVRGKMPVPVMQSGDGTGAAQPKVLEPFSYATAKPWHTKEVTVAGVKQNIAVPPKHSSIIDALPRHPNPEPGRRG